MMKLDYLFGGEIQQAQMQPIVDMHSVWQGYAFKDTEDLDAKIDTYDDGISCMLVNGTPVGVDESWLIMTEGKNDDIPRTEKELRERRDRKGNTRILVTHTIEKVERLVQIDGQKLADIYLMRLLKHYESEFCITYSPDTPPAQRMHDRHDACYLDNDFLLVDARPGLILEGTSAANVRPRGYRWVKNGSVYVSRELAA